MTRNWFGKRIIHKEDTLATKSEYLESDIRWEKIKIMLYFIIAFLYFYFIILGKTI